MSNRAVDRFKLEEAIFHCWNVVDDISYLRESMDAMCEDHRDNYLLGLETIYAVKFAKLQEIFEKCIKNGNL